MKTLKEQYKAYVKRVTKPVTMSDGVFYPDGFGEPCRYEQWLKSQKAEKNALKKFNKVFKGEI